MIQIILFSATALLAFFIPYYLRRYLSNINENNKYDEIPLINAKWKENLKKYTSPQRHLHFYALSEEIGSMVYSLYIRPFKKIVICGSNEFSHRILEDKTTMKHDSCKYLAKTFHKSGENILSVNTNTYHWKHSRSNLRKSFNQKNLKTIKTTASEIITDFIENRLGELAKTKTSFDVAEEMHMKTMEIISIVGLDYKASSDEIQSLITNISICGEGVYSYAIPFLQYMTFLPKIKKHHKAKDWLIEFGFKIIAHYKSKPSPVKGTMIDYIMCNPKYRNDKERVNDIIVSVFTAATETSAFGIAWTLILLSKHPDIQKSLQNEFKKYTNDQDRLKSNLFNNIINESLRLKPPVAIIFPRVTGKDFVYEQKVNGIDKSILVKKGTHVIISTHMGNRDKTVFENPNTFDPNRWDKMNLEHRNKVLSFGAGKQSCVGMPLALLEMRMFVLNILQKFSFELVKEPVEVYGVTMNPKGAHLVATALP